MPTCTAESAPPRLSSKRPSFLLLTALAAVGPFAMNIAVPAMPGLAHELDTTYGIIQFVLTAYLAAIALVQLILGPLSDRLGRRPVVLGGLLLYVLGSLICALAPSDGILIAGRIVQAAGGCAGLVIGRAIIRDLFDREQAASSLGYITMGMVVAPMLAPAVGGLLFDSLGWRSIFWLLLILGLGTLAASAAHLPETRKLHPTGEGTLFLSEVLALVTDRGFCGYAISLAFASGMFFSFLAGAPYVVTEILGKPASEYGLYFALSGLGYMLGNFLSGRFATRLGPDRMIVCGIALSGVGLSLLWLLWGIPHSLAIFGPMTVIAISNGLTIPSSTASAVSIRPSLAGAASGLAGSFQIGIGALLAFVVGLLHNHSAVPMMAMMTLSGILSLAGFLLTRDRRA